MDLPDNYHLIEDFVILYIFIYKKWVNLQRENNLASFVKEKDKFGLLKIKVEFQNIALHANEWDIRTYYKNREKNQLWRYHNQIDFETRNETNKYSKVTKGLKIKSKILEKNRNKKCPKCKEKLPRTISSTATGLSTTTRWKSSTMMCLSTTIMCLSTTTTSIPLQCLQSLGIPPLFANSYFLPVCWQVVEGLVIKSIYSNLLHN